MNLTSNLLKGFGGNTLFGGLDGLTGGGSLFGGANGLAGAGNLFGGGNDFLNWGTQGGTGMDFGMSGLSPLSLFNNGFGEGQDTNPLLAAFKEIMGEESDESAEGGEEKAPKPKRKANDTAVRELVKAETGKTDNELDQEATATAKDGTTATAQANTQPVTTTVNAAAPTGVNVGDPHFKGLTQDASLPPEEFDFDFQGVDGGIFNLYSDQTFQCNAQFKKFDDKGGTVIGKESFTLGNETVGKVRIVFECGQRPIVVDESGRKIADVPMEGEKGKDGKPLAFKPLTGLKDAQGRDVASDIKCVKGADGRFTLKINAGEVYTEVQDKLSNGVSHLDQSWKLTDLGKRSDGVDPHGVMGQTANRVVKGRKGHRAQGETVAGSKHQGVDGTMNDYVVKDGLLGTQFTFNKFGTPSTVPKVFGEGAHKTGQAV